MTTWITSDIHLAHGNIIKFCPKTRPYKDADHMNESIVCEWNLRVDPEDTVYILGDVAFSGAQRAAKLLSLMNGKKILIQGNHDAKLLRNQQFRECFEEIHQYLETTINGVTVVMFHYPINEWNQMHRGSVQFYGHTHDNKTGLEKYRARNVGMDATGKVVWNIEDAIADALQGQIKTHHSPSIIKKFIDKVKSW